MLERLKHMLIKEFIQMLRDPRMRAVIIIIPIVQVILFGYAVTTDVRHIATAVLDLDNSVQSRRIMARFEGSQHFDFVKYLKSEREIRPVLDGGRARAVIRFDKGFGEDVSSGRTGRIQILLDGTDANSAGIVLNYASSITGTFNGKILIKRVEAATGMVMPASPVELKWRAWFNPNLESRNFYVPGVIALLVMVITVMLSSMAIVREKEIGTIEQIMVTPIGRVEFILGKTLPFALIGFIDVMLISVIAVFWFRIPIEGNPLVLLFSTGLYLMSTLGAGLLISTVSRTQQQAMMTAFFFMLPAVLLSGFIYPIANMPVVIQWLTFADPLRYFIVIIRGVFLKGVGMEVLWHQMVGLLVLGTILLSAASARFKKTMA